MPDFAEVVSFDVRIREPYAVAVQGSTKRIQAVALIVGGVGGGGQLCIRWEKTSSRYGT